MPPLQDVWPVCRHGSLCPCCGGYGIGRSTMANTVGQPNHDSRDGQSGMGSLESAAEGSGSIPSVIEGTSLKEDGPWVTLFLVNPPQLGKDASDPGLQGT